MKKKILVTYSYDREIFKPLETNFDLTYPEGELLTKDDVLKVIGDYNILIPNSSFFTDKEVLDKASNLELIANFGVGYNKIDVDYASKKGIVVTNTPQSVLEPTAELCFGLLSATARNIGFYNCQLRTKEGLSWKLYDNLGVSIYGKTLGIFGMGRIGQAVARRAVAAGMKVIYSNRKQLDSSIEKLYNAQFVSFEDLISQSDFLSLNAPATPETYHIINASTIDRMKDRAILINVSRGSLVDEEALIAALKNGKLFGAGLDVFETEPKINPEFFKLENVVLTPHAGTQTLEARHDMQREVMKNIEGFYQNKKIARVN